ncbi:MAG: carbon monoxide dehydrogenase subunit G [Minisyncoccia bacterium]|jgi:carbon monoxide dehydrogenase subunit G|tara:strand:- start:807 stop:1277 length:471 start_codon:yes stop_codon:yes gene_type:complete
MSSQTLERELIVNAVPEEVWGNLTDVARAAAWLPFLHTISEREQLALYDAVLEDKVGRFALRADLLITVVDLKEFHFIVVKASGEDRQVRSRITIDAAIHLHDKGDGTTRARIIGTYEVTGKVATLGAGLIRSKARKMVDEFCVSAQEGLTNAGPS